MTIVNRILFAILAVLVIAAWVNVEQLREELYETQRLLCIKERERERWVYYAPCKAQDGAVLGERIKVKVGR